MKLALVTILGGVAVLLSGCAAGITRTGYKLPAGQDSKNLQRCPIAIQCDVQYNTNEVEVLGSIHAYDTGFSTDCDEAYVLDVFCREACYLGADVVDITEEHQPNPFTSTCYRAKATFLRYKDREKAKTLVSDAKYAPNLIIERSEKYSKRNRDVIAATVLGGALAGIVVSVATDPNATNTRTNSATGRNMLKP